MQSVRRKMSILIKKILRKLPGFKKIFREITEYRETTVNLQNTIVDLQNTINQMKVSIQQITDRQNQMDMEIQTSVNTQSVALKKNISHRFVIKRKAGIPVKVIFLIEEPSIIKNTLSLIEELSSDKRFEVVLVNLWYKVYKGDAYTYKRPNIESVLDVSKYTVLEAYDEETDQWLLLESLLPDYVFFLRSYDYYRNESYHIKKVSQYARTCYVPYGIQTIGGDVEKMVLTPECANLSYFFMDSAIRKDFISDTMRGTCFEKEGKLIYLGYPGMDMLRNHEEIKSVDSKWFTILWLPRWNNTENNCHFFEYKDVLIEYAKQYDDSRIVLRPHPLCFNNFINTGEMTEDELVQLKGNYSEPNAIDETSNYIDAFCASSVLVADETSLIAEYFLTEKPIVFCKKEMHISALMEKLAEGIYFVENWDELKATLTMLRGGNDPLYSKRLEIVERALFQTDKPSGELIKEQLVKDFYSQKM